MRTTAMIMMVLALGFTGFGRASEFASPTPTVLDFEAQKQKLELERLQMENEKLRLEMEQLKAQATKAPTATSAKESQGPNSGKEITEKDIKGFQADESKRAEELSQKSKEKANLIVLDLVNDEVWCKGVRYELDKFKDMAAEQKWPLKKKLDERDNSGYARYLYTSLNATHLKYDNRDKGIFTLMAPKNSEDLDFLTTTGVGSASTMGDVRTAFRNIYFEADGEDVRDGMHVLKFKHGHFLGFDEQIEVFFDKEGKFFKLRYGVLGEN